MPVVVTGASGLVGRRLVPFLAGRGIEVRACVRRPEAAGSLRAGGAKPAVVDLGDIDTLAAVMADAHTIVHLAGGLDLPDERYEEANLGTTERTLEAAGDAKVRRFVFLSYPGADPTASNAYLRAKGRAEEAVRASGLEHAIVRCTHIYGPGSAWLRAMVRAARAPVAAVVGPGTQRLAPVWVDDVVAVLAGADDRARTVEGTYALQGPDQVTADELVLLLAGRRRRTVHLSPAAASRVGRLMGRHLSRTLLEVMAADSVADGPDAALEFGVEVTPLRDGLTRSSTVFGVD